MVGFFGGLLVFLGFGALAVGVVYAVKAIQKNPISDFADRASKQGLLATLLPGSLFNSSAAASGLPANLKDYKASEDPARYGLAVKDFTTAGIAINNAVQAARKANPAAVDVTSIVDRATTGPSNLAGYKALLNPAPVDTPYDPVIAGDEAVD